MIRLSSPVHGDVKIRHDMWGAGDFYAPRSKTVVRDDGTREKVRYRHTGVDITVEPGEELLAVAPLKLVRIGFPYADDPSGFQLMVFRDAVGHPSVFQVWYYYVKPRDGLVTGDVVETGDVIGTAQDLRTRYNRPPMGPITPHCHLALELLYPWVLFGKYGRHPQKNVWVDPMLFMEV